MKGSVVPLIAILYQDYFPYHSIVLFTIQVLTSLLMAFVSPVTSDNQALRQCLSYFFPAYCYSSQGNQFQLQAVGQNPPRS